MQLVAFGIEAEEEGDWHSKAPRTGEEALQEGWPPGYRFLALGEPESRSQMKLGLSLLEICSLAKTYSCSFVKLHSWRTPTVEGQVAGFLNKDTKYDGLPSWHPIAVGNGIQASRQGGLGWRCCCSGTTHLIHELDRTGFLPDLAHRGSCHRVEEVVVVGTDIYEASQTAAPAEGYPLYSPSDPRNYP
jgi:hypothetical protein